MQIRAFVAIPLSEEMKEGIMQNVKKFPSIEGVKWVKKENLHITLKFLGNILYNKVNTILYALNEVGRRKKAFKIEVEGMGAFPDKRRARVLWFGISEGRETLSELAEDVQEALSFLSLKKEKFSPHITVARMKKLLNLEDFLSNVTLSKIPPMVVKDFVLMQSILSAEGAEYHPLGYVKIGGEDG